MNQNQYENGKMPRVLRLKNEYCKNVPITKRNLLI